MMYKSLLSLNKSYLSAVWKTNAGKILPASEKMGLVPILEVFRYKARKGTRAAALAAKKARKLQDASKSSPIPKYLQRKVKVSAELEKVRCVDENWLETEPIDDVWNMKLYRGKPYSVPEALNILRGMHIPSLLNDPSALVYITAELDLKLKKKDKFMDEFNGIITYPHEFEFYKKNKIIAICKETEDQMKAADAGAVYVGSTALIKQILSGTISSEDYDYVICHPDMYKELNVLRGILKRKFPTTNNGLLRLDIDRAIVSFIKGIEYKMKRSAIQPDFGWVEVCVGRLHMPYEEIEANLKHVLNVIEKHKPTGTDHILFVIRTLMWCEKVREKLKVPHWEYLQNYPENGILVEDKDEDESLANKTAKN